MKVIGIIAEYNPFHNGHAYLIRKAKEISGADAAAAVMSGDFMQRGTPAVFDKYTRAAMALAGGCDLVLELPAAAAASSAQRFAEGAAAILNGIGVIDELWFGSESGDMDLFRLLTPVLCGEPEEYRTLLKKQLASGRSFPRAREEALAGYFRDRETPEKCEKIREFLGRPNNILGLEYCIALRKTGSAIVPRTLRRLGADYNDNAFDAGSRWNSASAIRRQIFSGNDLKLLADSVPPGALGILQEACSSFSPIREDDFSEMLQYQLMREDSAENFYRSEMTGAENTIGMREGSGALCESADAAGTGRTGTALPEGRSFSRYLDVTEDLASRIRNYLGEYRSFSQFAALLSAKNYPRAQVNRALMHILLNIRDEDLSRALHPEYVHLLGFSEKGREVLREIKAGGTGRLCPVAKISSLPADLTRTDVFASNLYESVRAVKSRQDFVHEFSRPVIRI